MLQLAGHYDFLNKKSLERAEEMEHLTTPLALATQHGLIFCHQNFLYAFHSLKMIKTVYNIGEDIKNLSPQVINEVDENITMLNRNTLVSVSSAIEAALKTACRATKEFVDAKPPERLYLRWIVKHAKELGYLSEDCLEKWLFIIELRNSIVHNNSVPEQDLQFKRGDELILQTYKNKHISGPMKAIPTILEWAIDSYASFAFMQSKQI